MKIHFNKNIYKSVLAVVLLIISFGVGVTLKSWKDLIANLKTNKKMIDSAPYSQNTQAVDDKNVTRIIAYNYNLSSLDIVVEAFLSKPGFIVLAKNKKGSNNNENVEESRLLSGETGKIAFNKDKTFNFNDIAIISLYYDNGDGQFNLSDTKVASNFIILKK